MSLVKKIYYTGCSLLPTGLLPGNKKTDLLLPYHHTVSSEFLPHISHLYQYKNKKQFIKDLDFLLSEFDPITEATLLHHLNSGEPLKKKSFLLTFDDGFREVYENIAPILLQKSVPAVFFINPAFIDNKELFYRCKISLLIDEVKKRSGNKFTLSIFFNKLKLQNKTLENIIASLKNITQQSAFLLDDIALETGFSFGDFLEKQKPFLTSQQVQTLHTQGFSIGAHSIDHPYYKLLTVDEQFKQTVRSCNQVNQLTGTTNCSFSFPHSDKELSQELFDMLLKTDIPAFYGIQNQKEEWNNRMLHRFNAERPSTSAKELVNGITLLSWMRRLRGTNKLVRK